MAQYGTAEYWKERLSIEIMMKKVYLNALENVAKSEFPNVELIDFIAEKISRTNSDLEWYNTEYEKALETEKVQEPKDKSEENAD